MGFLKKIDFKSLMHIVSHLVFWVWNLVFIGIMYIWLLPQVGFELIQATRTGEIDPTFTVSFTALILVPLACTVLGFLRLRKYPVLLMRLFYGVEAPLFTLCLLRLFLIRELTVASGFVLGMVVVAIAMFAIELVSGYSAYRPKLATFQMVCHSVILLVGLYLGALLFLYSLPALVAVVVGAIIGFFQFGWVAGIDNFLIEVVSFVFTNPLDVISGLGFALIGCLMSFLVIASMLVFFSMPYVLVNFYVRAWARIRTAFGKQHGEQKSWALTGTTIAVCCALFVGMQVQPQTRAFNLLATSSTGQAEAASPEPSAENLLTYRQAQIDNAPVIKAGLTQAYLHRYRYLSPWSESNRLQRLYRDVFHMKEGSAQFFQTLHNGLLSPFLYRGDDSDAEQAAELYAQLFDTSIQEAERPAIRKSLQATANRDETSAGLLNLDQKIVRLARQAVTVTEQGDWATVELHERYENTTNDDQEIFYSFSLPESAAITGLWLGDAAHPKLFPFAVSPRGAAQQVYKGEVERGQRTVAVDPALLEQVGPRQYRLRVFPIPAARNDTENRHKRVPGELDLWMTYQVMQQDGAWPLPQLTEKRSIFWTDNTEHLRGKRPITLSEDQWFEAAIPASNKAKAQTHTVQLAEGYQVTATPMTKQEKRLPTGQRLAIVIDSSYSMGQHQQALKKTIDSLSATGKDNSLDFYVATAAPVTLANTPNTPKSPTPAPTKIDVRSKIDLNTMMFYGSLQPADMLQQFADNSISPDYDAVLLLTDEGSYELTKDEQMTLPNIKTPLWIVHVDGKLPSAYEDRLLQKLQASQGGVEVDAIAALQKIALAEKATTALEGYTWKVSSVVSPSEDIASKNEPSESNTQAAKTTPTPSNEAPNEFEGIAARQLIRQLSQTIDASQVSALDGVHVIAKRTGIVTPYSSMLVLVDERQKELLKEAEAAEDRFEREVEDGQDNLTEPGNPVTTSIPEPSQVLSLLVGAAALTLLKRRSTPASAFTASHRRNRL